MNTDTEQTAAYMILANALNIDPSVVTDDDLADFRNTDDVTEYETCIMRDRGDLSALASMIMEKEAGQ